MVKYIFENDDLQRIHNIHGGTVPPIGIIQWFMKKHKDKVKFSESRSCGDDYWVKVKIEDPEIQSQFESCVLRRSFDWITRIERLKKSSKLKIQQQLKRFHYKINQPVPIVFNTKNQEKWYAWHRWCQKNFGRIDINGRWYCHERATYFMRERDALLYQLRQPF